MSVPRILIIAGSDSGGGAGIQADIKTVTLLGGHAMTAITAITAQNTLGVQGVHPVPTDMVLAQMDSVISDIGVDAVKIGMIGSAQTAAAVAERLALLAHVPIVFDPVMVATSGSLLADDATIAAFERLMQVASVITPNAPELAALTGRVIGDVEQLEDAAQALREKTGAVIFAKGGHLPQRLEDDRPLIHDLLVDEDMVAEYSIARIETRHSHGTGCTLASAIAAGLGGGLSLADAVDRAEAVVAAVLKAAPGLGQGHGPMGHTLALTPFYHLLEANDQTGWSAADFAARYSDHA
ncbi:bifunctional hydroxymethylpyrimidine kinase/phosphomethylpyrimidine kinase [Sphingobium yanoikuyae]|jgi:hydroxymethylpyrimidine/phosphomethylpyrimidine kinase|uniref:hydroxymethylpyrimidine kinase n=1 Tax=Sphingobium yanoikuyae TaxID=13690 RepID=A0A085K3W2_SPHYA|nr:bifunctional hydroxymethylpyrimidine kinase/phosphomethylpyrimidine kinase [Sphingobium yanoikuyae]AYO80346.1 bifunctional hydroxymethylpyrimidine kinase/phosphomethylpyrimidine kinase [Sphingobium yanoikuyae]KFD27408.1 phosphomethylpyrimidine kinase [Sphingobium yanoikuyae]KZC80646.1 hydroxymethylpyrimidine/phosphomethylpyrimidine kinase [Sphingobium yanoikuyae]MDV3480043.1 bifunctional hydroxymethylpyrimidine kinase/phosphomethylpyrimidine kinase [Sphingobium yanoikuyae]